MALSKRGIHFNLWFRDFILLNPKQKVCFLICTVLSCLLISIIPRGDSLLTVTCYSGILLSYIGFSKQQKLLHWYGFIVLGFGIWFIPELSDDVYRFFWDAECMASGYSPYSVLPSELISQIQVSNAIQELVLSKNYYSVYPPILQCIYFPTAFFPTVYQKTIILGLCFSIIHTIGFFICRNQIGGSQISLLFSFPFFLIEGLQFHAEFLLIWPVVLFLFYLHKQPLLSGFFLGLMAAIKLWPILLSIIMLRKLQNGAWFSIQLLLIITLPLLSLFAFGFLENSSQILRSLSLYQSTFAFYGGLHLSIASLFNEEISRLILQVLRLISFLIILYQLLNLKWSGIGCSILLCLAYLMLSPNMHPWYGILPIGMLLFAYPKQLFWISTCSIGFVLSYLNYSNEIYTNHLWLAVFGNCIILLSLIITWRNRHHG